MITLSYAILRVHAYFEWVHLRILHVILLFTIGAYYMCIHVYVYIYIYRERERQRETERETHTHTLHICVYYIYIYMCIYIYICIIYIYTVFNTLFNLYFQMRGPRSLWTCYLLCCGKCCGLIVDFLWTYYFVVYILWTFVVQC